MASEKEVSVQRGETGTQLDPASNCGSQWHHWNPHIHAPGTVLEDRFGTDEPFEAYLQALESCDPPIRALGITDYYSTETYEVVIAAKKKGRLPDCVLIFPNVEMRLDLGTKKSYVNIHLLVSPEDPEHLPKLKRFLSQLTFEAYEETFSCSKEDLIRLGEARDPANPATALKTGTKHFKVSKKNLKAAFKESGWARENILVAVAGGADGTSGVNDPADATLREEIEKFADVIFAGSLQQRDFWIGQGVKTKEEVQKRYGGLKPCLNGCDAHELAQVGRPALDRFTWIKGRIHFDSLRQACIDPEGRAYVGPTPPTHAAPSQVIKSVEIMNAEWAKSPKLLLNPGLVTIISARGSGKTALADMIALGCDAMPDVLSEASFLSRANEHLCGSSIRLNWPDGQFESRQLDRSDEWDVVGPKRARYLSQKFVEDLCSSHGMTDSLLREIERVIYEAHSINARDGALNFGELLELRANRYREARVREEDHLAGLSDEIGAELDKLALIPKLKGQIAEDTKLLNAATADRAKLTIKGSEAELLRLNALNTAADQVRAFVRGFKSQQQSLLSLQDEVESLRTCTAPEELRTTQERFKEAKISDAEWNDFLKDYVGDVEKCIAAKIVVAQKAAQQWKGTPPSAKADPRSPFISDEAVLHKQTQCLLEAEIFRIGQLINADKQTKERFEAFSKKITLLKSGLERLAEKLTTAEGARKQIQVLAGSRRVAYKRIFEAIVSEQQVLNDLYSPLLSKVQDAEGTLGKLSFTVSRNVDLKSWAERGQQMFDLRLKGPVRGKGALQERADALLRQAWERGSAEDVSQAMTDFREEYEQDILKRAKDIDRSTYKSWSKIFAQWLYSTDHIKLEYSITYDGIDIRKLSPGTRGIVLLLLYLALDEADDSPLIIDQPEENLDPKSIFDELVELFLKAKNKRQVIMVTHNANLVVNTDADQIIVASVGPSSGKLPPITYISGGLEDSAIRTAVCDILEGGERAFKERARRLRVRIDRHT